MTFSVAMMLGPLFAGVLVASVGYAWTYSVDVVTFLASRPNLRMTFLADIVAMATAFPRALLPAVGAVVGATMLGGGEAAVGILLAAMALGAFLTGLFSGPLTRIVRHGLAVYAAIMAWGVAVAGFGLVVYLASRAGTAGADPAAYLWPAAGCLALAGCADSVSSVFRNTILQTATPDHLRGRLQGVFIVVVAGGPRVGEMLTGGAAELLTEPVTLIAGGLLCVLGASLLMRWQPGFLRYDARHPLA